MLKNKLSITGASGFIGRHLLEYLDKNNYCVTVLDSNSATYPIR